MRLKEYEGALREYKRENGKFFEMKERYKTTIAGLEKDVQVGGAVGVAVFVCGGGGGGAGGGCKSKLLAAGWVWVGAALLQLPGLVIRVERVGGGSAVDVGVSRSACHPMRRLVQAKEKDKQQLLEMCNELVTRLEREGLSV